MIKNIKDMQSYDNEIIFRLKSYENIVHDIKMPLTIIYSTLQILEVTENLNKSTKEHLESIKNSCYRAMKLINDISDFSKIYNGYLFPKFRNYDIVPLIRNISESSFSFAQRKEISINFVSNIKSVIISTDKDMIERILLNLLSNAIKFTKYKGNVDIIFTEYKNFIKIVVRDNGPGIDDKDINTIFERYNILENERGTGIGLSIVKELVELLNGEISVRNVKKGSGLEFTIKLPIKSVVEEIKDIEVKDDFYSDNMVQIELSDYY